MRIDIEWLGEMLQRNLDPEQLAEQLTLGGLEVESVRLAGTAEVAGVDGVVLDFDITPNRGDCFSVQGIAREVSALDGKRMEPPAVPEVPITITGIHRWPIRSNSLAMLHGCSSMPGV